MKEAMSSPDLLPVITGTAASKGKEEGGEPLYITMAKARMAQQLAQDAQGMSENGMALVVEADQMGKGRVSTDAIETGTGPIVMDTADWKGCDGMTTGKEMRRMMEIIREQEHPLPEVMAGEEMEPRPVKKRSSLVRLLQRLASVQRTHPLGRPGKS